jgi:hypothetical protein
MLTAQSEYSIPPLKIISRHEVAKGPQLRNGNAAARYMIAVAINGTQKSPNQPIRKAIINPSVVVSTEARAEERDGRWDDYDSDGWL